MFTSLQAVSISPHILCLLFHIPSAARSYWVVTEGEGKSSGKLNSSRPRQWFSEGDCTFASLLRRSFEVALGSAGDKRSMSDRILLIQGYPIAYVPLYICVSRTSSNGQRPGKGRVARLGCLTSIYLVKSSPLIHVIRSQAPSFLGNAITFSQRSVPRSPKI